MPDQDDHDNNIRRMQQAIRDLREPLGELALHFAALEDQVTMAIISLLRLTPQEGYILETVMRDFGSRIRLFQALVNLTVKDDHLRNLGQKITNLLLQANSDRNNLLHDAWNSYSPEVNGLNKIRFVLNEKGELTQPPLYELTRQVIAETVAFIERVGLLVADWRARFNWRDLPHVSPAPLPDRWYGGSPLHTHMKGQKQKQGR
ncbi:MAG TPA: hypothetical protein VJY34_09555 [Roseiarcus sp.]|nr:hypothetical protein [Roseiarcus sp.]